ncbi:hypothetical protein D3C72_1368930 [compost metagenome]
MGAVSLGGLAPAVGSFSPVAYSMIAEPAFDAKSRAASLRSAGILPPATSKALRRASAASSSSRAATSTEFARNVTRSSSPSRQVGSSATLNNIPSQSSSAAHAAIRCFPVSELSSAPVGCPRLSSSLAVERRLAESLRLSNAASPSGQRFICTKVATTMPRKMPTMRSRISVSSNVGANCSRNANENVNSIWAPA